MNFLRFKKVPLYAGIFDKYFKKQVLLKLFLFSKNNNWIFLERKKFSNNTIFISVYLNVVILLSVFPKL